jgi:hypothetical protein
VFASRPASPSRRRIGRALLWLSAIATLVAAILAATGGFVTEIGGIRVSMRAVIRPTIAAITFGILGFAALGRDASLQHLGRFSSAAIAHARWIALAFAAAIAIATYSGGAQIAGGTDSSGYLSQARMWRSGTLRVQTPLAHELTFSTGQYAFTPGGYQPSAVGESVPGYPPGLPLMFAALAAVGGEQAQFMVVPLCAGAIVLIAFAIGRRLGGTETALIAAAAAGASPILLFQAAQPMSDVPAAFWWTLTIWLLLVNSWPASAAAGMAAACACLVRPNMFAIAPVLAVLTIWWYGWNRTSIARSVLLMIPVGVAAGGFVYLQQTLFGGATRTGYGPVETLFALDNVWRNLARYPRWAIFVQSILIVISVAAPFVLRTAALTPAIDRARAVRVAWSGLILFAAVQGLYLLYLVFDDWVYFRFLLPALPLVLVLEAVVLAAAVGRAPSGVRGLAALALAVLVASWGVGRARDLGAFRLQDSEHRYLDVAEFTRQLPPDAVYVTLQYAGSLWYYRAVPLLRWDWIDASEMDGAIDQLAARSRPVYAVIDDWELPLLRERYAGTRFVTRFATPLFQAGEPAGIKAQVYDVTGTTAAAAVR